MNPTPNQPSFDDSVAAEPKAGLHPVPVWLFVLFFLSLYWGMVYFDQHGGWFAAEVYTPYHSIAELELYAPGPGQDRQGKIIFEANCALCHNPDGMGKPNQGPPFVGSEWVLGSPSRLIRIPQNGLNGPIKVKDQEYNISTGMAGMGHDLKDDELAAVLTYIRTSWGNKATPITAAQVKAIRAQIGSRAIPWSAQELQSIP